MLLEGANKGAVGVMTIPRVAILLVATVLGLSAGSRAAAQEQSITPQIKAQLEKKALQGSGAAALKVAMFHGTRDTKLMEYWTWIGAENGDPTCQFNYGSLLNGRGDSYSQMRAIYWMRKAAARKVRFAEETLKDMLREQEEKR
jgi:TPR repeat protein